MGQNLSGKVAVVTGAGRGIGRETALAFACEGAGVAICSRRKNELLATAQEAERLGAKVNFFDIDISSPEQVDRMIGATVAALGRIDYLVNNAGILGPHFPLAEVAITEWDETIRINLSGAFYVTRAALKAMNRGGAIVNLSSSVGRRGRAGWGAYAVSKFGIEGLTQTLAEELREERIRVVSFNPGGTRTAMRAAAYPNEERSELRDPAEVARMIIYLASATDLSISGHALDAEEVKKMMGKKG